MAQVLLIDDDEMVREVHAELLAAAGHQTMQAGSGVAGIEAIRAARPDLVLCDVSMPGMDGYAVLEAVRADPQISSTPFLFLTGLDTRHHFRAAMSLGGLWHRQGRRRDACRLLGGAYGWFSEGFDTGDLRAARALLTEWE